MTVADPVVPSEVGATGLHDPLGPPHDVPGETLDARQLAERIDALLGELGRSPDPRAVERAEDLVSVLMRFYGAGLRRILQLADDEGALDAGLLDRLLADQLVASLLVIHDLHPVDLATRVQHALDGVRPYLGSHGGDVSVEAIEDGVVRLRMAGSCSGCPSSSVTLTYAVERAILDAAPEIARIEAIDVEPAPTLIQLESRGVGSPGGRQHLPNEQRTEWVTLADVPGASLSALELAGLDVLLCRADDGLFAYRDRCANCRSTLDGGHLDGTVLTCATCGYRFDVRLAGRSIGDGGLHLDPLPLLTDDGTVRVAVPVGLA